MPRPGLGVGGFRVDSMVRRDGRCAEAAQSMPKYAAPTANYTWSRVKSRVFRIESQSDSGGKDLSRQLSTEASSDGMMLRNGSVLQDFVAERNCPA